MPATKTVLLLAPFGRDADALASVVHEKGYHSSIISSIGELSNRLDDTVGTVVLTEEAIAGDLGELGGALRAQEPWSDIPFVLLRASRSPSPSRRPALPEEAINVIELERPLSAASLVSAVTTALRARHKQFIIRDQMARLAQSQAALAESEAELRLIADAVPVLIAFVDRSFVYRFANLAYEDWFGVPISDVLGHTVEEVVGTAAWLERKDAIEQVLSGRPVRLEVSWPRPDGRRRDAEIRYLPRFSETGEVDGFHVFATDVTVRKVALEITQQHASALEERVKARTADLEAEMAAREISEAALRQSQKMEAVGQLTGGIAHDFNNMLTGIMAAMDLMRMGIDDGRLDSLSRYMDVATTSAQRAAALTQRLLAFSRRQSLDPTPVDINARVRSMEDMLTRTLGERVHLFTELAKDLPRALVDANQLESALLNLAINARDAMLEGGDLCVRTEMVTSTGQPKDEAPQGTYVVMSVIDSGAGMTDDVLSRIFEPFFTTKPIGQGTGLGMSMIYGFIQQSNGHVRVSSKVGEGTAVKLFLPLADESAPSPDKSAPSVELKGHGQNILLVEDDPGVRILVAEVLTELGYEVATAETGDAALSLLGSTFKLDLLVTDVGLPGINGRQLAEIVRQSWPGLPVLFLTGYAQHATTQSDFLEPGMTMMTKPFNLDALRRTVSRILHGPEP